MVHDKLKTAHSLSAARAQVALAKPRHVEKTINNDAANGDEPEGLMYCTEGLFDDALHQPRVIVPDPRVIVPDHRLTSFLAHSASEMGAPRNNNIIVTVHPSEQGAVVYQKIAPALKEGENLGSSVGFRSGMLYLYFDITNQYMAPMTLTLAQVAVSFPDSSESTPPPFPHSVSIATNATQRIWLRSSEAIHLLADPKLIKIVLSFEENIAPVELTFPLKPHQITYRFFAKAESTLNFGKYIAFESWHFDEKNTGGSQVFALDGSAVGWVDHKLIAYNGLDTPENYFTMHRPVYSAGKGIVVFADDSHLDNPTSKKRRIEKQEYSWESTFQVVDASVTCITPTSSGVKSYHVIVASVTSLLAVKFSVFTHDDINSTLSELTQVGDNGRPLAYRVTVAAIDNRDVVTVTHKFGAGVITLWRFVPSATSVSVKILSSVTMSHTVSSIKLVNVGQGQFVTMSRIDNNSLLMELWARAGSTVTALPLAQTMISPHTLFDLALIDSGESRRIAAAFKLADGNLRVAVWRIDQDGSSWKFVTLGTLDRGPVEEVSIVRMEEDRDYFAVSSKQPVTGFLRFLIFKCGPMGPVKFVTAETVENVVTGLQMVPFKKDAIAIVYRAHNSDFLRFIGYEVDIGESSVSGRVLDEPKNTEVTKSFSLALLRNEQPAVVTVIRTPQDHVKVILWQFSDGNSLKILNKDTKEIITYSHLAHDSIPSGVFEGASVVEGQRIAEMGFSGSAGGPHLHIQAEKLKPEYQAFSQSDLTNAIRRKVEVGDPRPLQFTGAQSIARSLVQESEPNPYAKVDGAGFHFYRVVVLPEK